MLNFELIYESLVRKESAEGQNGAPDEPSLVICSV